VLSLNTHKSNTKHLNLYQTHVKKNYASDLNTRGPLASLMGVITDVASQPTFLMRDIIVPQNTLPISYQMLQIFHQTIKHVDLGSDGIYLGEASTCRLGGVHVDVLLSSMHVGLVWFLSRQGCLVQGAPQVFDFGCLGRDRCLVDYVPGKHLTKQSIECHGRHSGTPSL